MTTSLYSPAAQLSAWFMRRTAPSAVRRVASLKAALASDIGVVREENQDRVALVRGSDRKGATFILAALADGVGGMKQGAECASITLGAFIDGVVTAAQHSQEPRDWLRQGTLRANYAVHEKHGGDGGSTLVAILFANGHRPIWVGVGDSRVYYAADATLRQLSCDDTLEGQLGKPIKGGRRSELLQYVGIGASIEPHIEQIPWDAPGTMLLTTDGVHFIDADYLAKVVHFAPDLGVCARRLTDLAKMLGGPDNASVAAVSLDALKMDSEPVLDSCLEVWDPFGELHVIFESGLRCRDLNTPPSPALKSSTVVAATEAALERGLKVPSQEAGNAPAEQLAKVAAEKGKSPNKAKGGRKNKDKGLSENGESAAGTEVPQLLIKFPHESS